MVKKEIDLEDIKENFKSKFKYFNQFDCKLCKKPFILDPISKKCKLCDLNLDSKKLIPNCKVKKTLKIFVDCNSKDITKIDFLENHFVIHSINELVKTFYKLLDEVSLFSYLIFRLEEIDIKIFFNAQAQCSSFQNNLILENNFTRIVDSLKNVNLEMSIYNKIEGKINDNYHINLNKNIELKNFEIVRIFNLNFHSQNNAEIIFDKVSSINLNNLKFKKVKDNSQSINVLMVKSKGISDQAIIRNIFISIKLEQLQFEGFFKIQSHIYSLINFTLQDSSFFIKNSFLPFINSRKITLTNILFLNNKINDQILMTIFDFNTIILTNFSIYNSTFTGCKIFDFSLSKIVNLNKLTIINNSFIAKIFTSAFVINKGILNNFSFKFNKLTNISLLNGQPILGDISPTKMLINNTEFVNCVLEESALINIKYKHDPISVDISNLIVKFISDKKLYQLKRSLEIISLSKIHTFKLLNASFNEISFNILYLDSIPIVKITNTTIINSKSLQNSLKKVLPKANPLIVYFCDNITINNFEITRFYTKGTLFFIFSIEKSSHIILHYFTFLENILEPDSSDKVSCFQVYGSNPGEINMQFGVTQNIFLKELQNAIFKSSSIIFIESIFSLLVLRNVISFNNSANNIYLHSKQNIIAELKIYLSKINSLSEVIGGGIYSYTEVFHIKNSYFNFTEAKKGGALTLKLISESNLTFNNVDFKNIKSNTASTLSIDAIDVITFIVHFLNCLIENNISEDIGSIQISNLVTKKSMVGLENVNLFNIKCKYGAIISIENINFIVLHNVKFNNKMINKINDITGNGYLIYLKLASNTTLSIEESKFEFIEVNSNLIEFNDGISLKIENSLWKYINFSKISAISLLNIKKIIIKNSKICFNMRKDSFKEDILLNLKQTEKLNKNLYEELLKNNTSSKFDSKINLNLNDKISFLKIENSNCEIDNLTINNIICLNCSGSGIFFLNSDIILKNSIFLKNVALKGGVFYFESFKNNKNIQIIQNCNFSYNLAEIGGSIYFSNRFINLIDINFEENKANFEGGAFYIKNNEEIIINDKTIFKNLNFIKNFARIGGIFIYRGVVPLMINLKYINNKATFHGKNGPFSYPSSIILKKKDKYYEDNKFKIINMRSGGIFKDNSIEFLLKDENNEIIPFSNANLDFMIFVDENFISKQFVKKFSVVAQEVVIFNNKSKSIPLKPLVIIRSVTYNATLKVSSKMIKNIKNGKILEDYYYKIFVDFRDCIIGEIFVKEKNTCEVCNKRSFSLNIGYKNAITCYTCPLLHTCDGGYKIQLSQGNFIYKYY